MSPGFGFMFVLCFLATPCSFWDLGSDPGLNPGPLGDERRRVLTTGLLDQRFLEALGFFFFF